MMNKIKYYIGICLWLCSFMACKEEKPTPLSEGGTPPGLLTNVQVENLPGGAKFTYVLPNSEDLLYIKAIYEFPEGTIQEVKASAYVDTLVIQGIGNVMEREVKLFTVSRSEVLSEPVLVKIKPLIPPVHQTAASLSFKEVFGGVELSYDNEKMDNLVINLLKKESDEWLPIDVLYTNKKKGVFSIRNQDAILTEFGAFVKDRWSNHSDTVKTSLTPLYEIKIPNPKPVFLQGDYNLFYGGLDYNYFVDGNTTNVGETLMTGTSPMPQSFTLDFKIPTVFSRLKYYMWPRGASYEFNYASAEKWEIWGANELVDDWSRWTKIMNCVAVKPSGAPLGTMTVEDTEFSRAGIDFSFPSGTPAYRYIRWKTTKTFGGLKGVNMAEITFWGNQK